MAETEPEPAALLPLNLSRLSKFDVRSALEGMPLVLTGGVGAGGRSMTGSGG